ncbi:unnamed protein product, partial [Didymodactylos carnosus]
EKFNSTNNTGISPLFIYSSPFRSSAVKLNANERLDNIEHTLNSVVDAVHGFASQLHDLFGQIKGVEKLLKIVNVNTAVHKQSINVSPLRSHASSTSLTPSSQRKLVRKNIQIETSN